MEKQNEIKHSGSIGDAAVRAKTGKDWAEWFAVLDAVGAQQLGHKGIVAHLRDQYGVDTWWQQAITVAYEQARGMRDLHQMPNGYQVSVSKTVAVPVAQLWAAWQDDALREHWLPATPFVVRKATPEKSMRLLWVDGKSTVSVMFTPKGDAKSQVSFQHSQLPDAAAAAELKSYWAAALERLKHVLETSEWSVVGGQWSVASDK